jgi:polyisoprenoid-binding protein YceI
MKKQFAVAVALALAAVSAFAAETYVVDKAHSEAKFEVTHLVSRVSGKFNDVSGKITGDPADAAGSSVEFTIKTASIDTGNEGRDKHLRTPDFFDAEKFPEITFKSTAIKPTVKKGLYEVTGDLTMRGVTKRVTLPVEFRGFAKDPSGNTRAGFTAKTTLNRKDYGINWNRTFDEGGVLLGDDVDVVVNIEAPKQKPAPPAPPAPAPGK